MVAKPYKARAERTASQLGHKVVQALWTINGCTVHTIVSLQAHGVPVDFRH